MKYIQHQDLLAVFRFIQDVLTEDEPAPQYAAESTGMAELTKVLEFVQNDSYYPAFPDKCAYLICSIAGAQYFSNGNKRLAVFTLMQFLLLNDTEVWSADDDAFGALMHQIFPLYTWEENKYIPLAEQQFLYNLAIVIGDPNVWGTDKFDVLKEKVGEILGLVYRLPEAP
jgi:prophage maintenance system killer protein